MKVDLIMIFRVTIIIYALVYLTYLIKDCIAHKEEFTRKHVIVHSIIGFVTNLFDTLGIGSMATSMAAFRFTKSCKDEHLCGTGNVAFTICTMTEFVLFLGLIKVDTITLISMIAASVVGSVIGASIVSKWSVKVVRTVLGVALLCVAVIMACKTLEVGPFGMIGTATSLTGGMLIVGIIGNLFLGAFQTMGIGLYAPCMALVSLLGMNVAAAFPIMMGSCAFLMPSCSMKFIKEGKYNRQASIYITIFGVLGVVVAYYFIKSVPLKILIWIVVAVMIYTSYTFFRDVLKDKKEDIKDNMCTSEK